MPDEKLFVVGHAYCGIIPDSDKKKMDLVNYELLKQESQMVTYESSIVKISESQALRLQSLPPLSGKPIYYNHDYDYGRIGDIIKLYFDTEQKIIDIVGVIYKKEIIEKIRNGTIKSFSIGIRQVISESQFYAQNISTILDEVSVTENPYDRRCSILVKMNKSGKQNLIEEEDFINIELKLGNMQILDEKNNIKNENYITFDGKKKGKYFLIKKKNKKFMADSKTTNLVTEVKKEEVKEEKKEEVKKIEEIPIQQKSGYDAEEIAKLVLLAKKVGEKKEKKIKKDQLFFAEKLKKDDPIFFKDDVMLKETVSEIIGNKKTKNYFKHLLEKNDKSEKSDQIQVTQKKKEDTAVVVQQKASNKEGGTSSGNKVMGGTSLTNEQIQKINSSFFDKNTLDNLIKSLDED